MSSLTQRARELFTSRGGSKAAREDAQELKDVVTGQGSMSDRARRGFEAIREPGAPGSHEQHAASAGASGGADRAGESAGTGAGDGMDGMQERATREAQEHRPGA